MIGDYTTPDWVDIAGDTGVVIGALLALVGLVTLIVKATQWLDRRKDQRFAAQVQSVVAPLIDAATQSIQPGYRNGGESLADVAAVGKANARDLRDLHDKGDRRDAKIDRLAETVDRLDERSDRMESRQIEMEVREERIVTQAIESAKARDAMVDGMLANGEVVWKALTDLGADMPDMIRPDNR